MVVLVEATDVEASGEVTVSLVVTVVAAFVVEAFIEDTGGVTVVTTEVFSGFVVIASVTSTEDRVVVYGLVNLSRCCWQFCCFHTMKNFFPNLLSPQDKI